MSFTNRLIVFLGGVAVGVLLLGIWLASPWGTALGAHLRALAGDHNAQERESSLIARFETEGVAQEPDETATAALAPGPRARGVVLVIGDGMGASQLLAGRIASVGLDGRLAIERMPVSTWVSTHSATSLYTDSAAAAAAMATGEKTAPALLARRPDGTPLRTIFEAARDAGMDTASVTDTYVLDATPAAFIGHGRRRDYEPLARDAAASGIAVLAGVVRDSRPGARDDDTLSRGLRDRGYQIARDVDAWQAALDGSAPIAGFFGRGTIADPSTEPNLASLAVEIFDRVSSNPAGFVMLVESEETDTGGHDNDFDRVVRGVVTLDRTVAAIVDRAKTAGDVLVLVTADHETGGLGLTEGARGEPIRVRWSTRGHTAEPVPLFAFGPGADRVATVRDNTEIADAIIEVLGLTLEQPPR